MTAKFSRDMSGIGFRVKGHIIDAAAVILTAVVVLERGEEGCSRFYL